MSGLAGERHADALVRVRRVRRRRRPRADRDRLRGDPLRRRRHRDGDRARARGRARPDPGAAGRGQQAPRARALRARHRAGAPQAALDTRPPHRAQGAGRRRPRAARVLGRRPVPHRHRGGQRLRRVAGPRRPGRHVGLDGVGVPRHQQVEGRGRPRRPPRVPRDAARQERPRVAVAVLHLSLQGGRLRHGRRAVLLPGVGRALRHDPAPRQGDGGAARQGPHRARRGRHQHHPAAAGHREVLRPGRGGGGPRLRTRTGPCSSSPTPPSTSSPTPSSRS